MLHKMIRKSNKRAILGDIEEIYQDILEQKGLFKANVWYSFQLIKSLPFIIYHLVYWKLTMIKNYLKITIRNMRKYKGYSFINIAGLALGMASFIFISLWILHELSYDKFHKNLSELYIVNRDSHYENRTQRWTETPGLLAATLKNEYPEILETTRVHYPRNLLCNYEDNYFVEERILAVDPSFLKMFTFPMIKGDTNTALNNPSSVVLTKKIANKYFGEKNPIGKTINVDRFDNLTVTGIIEDLPPNSSFDFELLIPINCRIVTYETRIDAWSDEIETTYVLLQKKKSYLEINQKIAAILQKHKDNCNDTIRLEPFAEIHTNPDIAHLNMPSVNASYIYLFLTIACFVLLIACINFINLSTARSAQRAKEIGIRKVSGASKQTLIKQFWTESILYSSIASLLSYILIKLLLPNFNRITGKEIILELSQNDFAIPFFIGLPLFVGLVAGCYPAFFLSSFHPANILKGKLRSGIKNKSFRKGLVIFQFTLSIMLILSTMVVHRQLTYMKNEKLGYDKEHLISIPLVMHWGHREDGSFYKSFKNELMKYPNIRGVTQSFTSPVDILTSAGEASWEGKKDDQTALIRWMSVHFDYIEMLGLEIIDGRSFSKEFPVDNLGDWRASTVVLNEEAVQQMGIESPIGKRFKLYGKESTIIGVVKNYHFRNLRHKIEPQAMFITPFFNNVILIKTIPENIQESLEIIHRNWKKHAKNYPFEYKFVDEEYDNIYKLESKMGLLLNYFTALAVLIACLGLFGLTVFSTEQYTQEIGIRKVFGASILNIILMLIKEFAKWVLIAIFIAWPIAGLIMDKWLQNYAYRAELNIWIFVASGIVTLFFVLLTISYQAIKAAAANPIDSLKYE